MRFGTTVTAEGRVVVPDWVIISFLLRGLLAAAEVVIVADLVISDVGPLFNMGGLAPATRGQTSTTNLVLLGYFILVALLMALVVWGLLQEAEWARILGSTLAVIRVLILTVLATTLVVSGIVGSLPDTGVAIALVLPVILAGISWTVAVILAMWRSSGQPATRPAPGPSLPAASPPGLPDPGSTPG